MEESSPSDANGPATRMLGDLLRRVHDRGSFLEFVNALLDDYDLYKTEAVAPSGLPYRQWENGTDFGENLSACLVWARHPIAKERWFPEEASWQSFATFLYMAKIFE